MPNVDAYRYIAVENIVRTGEIACNKKFLLISQCFPPYMALSFHFKCTLKMSSAICFNLEQSKFLSSGNGLICIERESADQDETTQHVLSDPRVLLAFFFFF